MSTTEKAWFSGPRSDPYRYLVHDPEGIAGGEALVFRARRQDGRHVALKQLAQADPTQRERLLDQAAALSKLHHPNVIEQLDAFVGPGLFDGSPPADEDFELLYLVSTWAEGDTLASLGALPTAAAALDVLEDVAAGVDHLHANGVVHRDLHPGNVVVTADHAVVIDLAYVRTAAPPAISVVFGAPGFVPPERLDDPGSADESADRWQVAMLAVHLLLGRPRRRESLSQLRDKLATTLAGAVPDAAASADQIVGMLASDPESRPSIPLEEWMVGIRSAAAEQRKGMRPGDHPRRTAAALLAIIGLAASGTIATVLGSRNDEPGTRPATGQQLALGASAPCLIPIGRSDRRIALPAALYAEIVELGRGVHACPTSIVDAWGSMAVQTFDANSPVGALVSSGPGHSFALTQAEWSSYRTIGAPDENRAAEIAGPIASITTTPTSDVLRTAKGELVGDSPNAPHVFRPFDH